MRQRALWRTNILALHLVFGPISPIQALNDAYFFQVLLRGYHGEVMSHATHIRSIPNTVVTYGNGIHFFAKKHPKSIWNRMMDLDPFSSFFPSSSITISALNVQTCRLFRF